MQNNEIRMFVMTVCGTIFFMAGCSTTEKAEIVDTFVAVQTPMIDSVRYYPTLETLAICFQDAEIYDYFNVPSDVYKAFMQAKKKDDYYQNNIKKVYKSQRFVYPEPQPSFSSEQLQIVEKAGEITEEQKQNSESVTETVDSPASETDIQPSDQTVVMEEAGLNQEVQEEPSVNKALPDEAWPEEEIAVEEEAPAEEDAPLEDEDDR